MAIAVLGFLVWGHHMFVSGQSMYAGMVFSILSFLVAVPSAIKVFNWTATMYKGSITLETPMLYALGFIGLFTMGGLTGLMLATLGLDVHVHDTYFVVAHFHYIMVGGAVMAYMGGIHFWWPKLSGRMYPELLGKLSALTVFVGFNLTFFPQFVLGYLGMPRRYYEYSPEYQVLNVMSTAGASILAVGYVLPLAYLLFSLRRAARRGPEPLASHGPGVADRIAAAGPQLRRDSRRDQSSLRLLSRRNRGFRCIRPPLITLITARPPADDEPILSHQFDDVEQQSEASTLGMWLFLATEVMFFGGLLTAYAVYRIAAPPGGRSGEQRAQRRARVHQYRRPVDEQPDHGPGGSCGSVASASELVRCLVLTMVLGTVFLGIKAIEWTARLSRAPRAGVEFSGARERSVASSSKKDWIREKWSCFSSFTSS